MRERFEEDGLYGPVPVLTAREASAFLGSAWTSDAPSPLDWNKGYAATSRAYYALATHPSIVGAVAELLGPDVILWGASIQSRTPGHAHAWHSDIEVTDSAAPTVAVWIGLRGTNPLSSLRVVTRSHRFAATIQEVRFKEGVAREEVSDEHIRRWAAERDPEADLRTVAMTDGEALFFDGRMWHASNNRGKETRHALLLQYATPDMPIRIPDPERLDWPFRHIDTPRPPSLLVRGRATHGAARIVRPPAVSDRSTPVLTGQVRSLEVPLSESPGEPWKPHHLFRGVTADVVMSCHASYLAQGHSPHPPHQHVEEEILLVLRGEVELELPRLPGGTRTLGAGGFVYYPAWFPHTLRASSTDPANYLMFKWTGTGRGSTERLGFQQHDLGDHFLGDDSVGFTPRVICEGPTGALRKLQAHATTLGPGDGYEPHVDAYDVAIVVVEGEIETLGRRATPHDVIFYPAGEPHGMHNPTDRVARYVVFEFHGAGASVPPQPTVVRRAKRILVRALPERVATTLRRSLRFR